MKNKADTLTFAAAILACLASCSSSPSVQYYLLEPQTVKHPSIINLEQRQTFGIGPISVPSLLENKKIITRLSDNTVQIAQFQQWASPLSDNILQTIAYDLASLQPDRQFLTYPWHIHGKVDYQIVFDVIRFDASLGKSVDLEVNWTIKDGNDNKVVKSGRTSISQPLSDTGYPGAVHGLSKILGELSLSLSSQVAGL